MPASFRSSTILGFVQRSSSRHAAVCVLLACVILSIVHPVHGDEALAPVAGTPVQAAAESTLRDAIQMVQPSVVTIRVKGRDGDEIGVGTGFVINAVTAASTNSRDGQAAGQLDEQGEDLLIATNFHVITEGRPFTVHDHQDNPLSVLAVQASDVKQDLAIIRVQDPGNLKPLQLADSAQTQQGTRVLAFGNPHGMKNSVVEGIISATQMIEGRELLQMAMPIEPGNSGGPLVGFDGRVHGIVNMKSAIENNIGFAIPVAELQQLIDNPNPVSISRWVNRGTLSTDRWTALFGANWQQRGGRIIASGVGKGFGGRSLLLSKNDTPELPFEVAVSVRLNDESGAAGLTFHSDGNDKHYGFYPSAGQVRLTCFRGPSVYSWQVLREIKTKHYHPGQWNDLKVRLEKGSIKCFVNGHLVIESTDRQLTSGKIGLAKFRTTQPEFKGFRFGSQLSTTELSDEANQWLSELQASPSQVDQVTTQNIIDLGQSGELASREIVQQATELERQADQLRRLAKDVRRANTIEKLERLLEINAQDQLLEGALLIAAIDYPDLDRDAYRARIDEMANEILGSVSESDTVIRKREALHDYLFNQNGFHGSRSEYYHPANSHLNRVIDDREGLPITLSVLYMELGRRIGIEVQGVGMPGHFIVRHVIDEDEQQLIDVFERGATMSLQQARRNIAMYTGRPMVEQDLRANTAVEILTRMLNNLTGIAGRNEDGESLLAYLDAIIAINPDDIQRRMMRAQLHGFTGRAKRGIEQIDKMLKDDTVGLDRSAAVRLRNALQERLADTTH